MAQSITEGLFPSVAGLFATPGAEQARRLELAAQPVSPLNAVSGDIGFLGERMRQGIGSAFGQMPEQDRKRMQAQQAAQELQQQGVDVSTPEGLLQLAQRLDALPGFTGESLAIRQAAAQMAQQSRMQGIETQFKQSQIAKNLAETGSGNIKVNSDFLKLVAPEDRAKVIQAYQAKQPIPSDITYIADTDKSTTEFERLIQGLPPEEQARLKSAYINKKIQKDMPTQLVPVALKESNDLNSIVFGASDVAKSIDNLKSGKLKLGLKDNFFNALKTAAGSSDEGSRAYSQFTTALETLRNARLNLNTGVQTEGDALRAANEFLANYDRYDTKTALEQLDRVFSKMRNAYKTKQNSLKQLYSSTGTPLPDSFFTEFPTVSGSSQVDANRAARASAAQQPQPASNAEGQWRIINTR